MATSSSTLDKTAVPGEVERVEPASSWWSEAWAVFRKDVRSEARTKAAVGTILLFAIVTLMVVSYLQVTEGRGLTTALVDNYQELLKADPGAIIERSVPGGTKLRAQILSAFLWIVLFFSAMAGLPRTFVKEEEMRTAAALRLAARPAAVFAGKLLFNVLLLLTVTVVVLPLFLVMFTPGVANWPSLLLHLLVGSVGMAGTATILGAMVARAGGKSYLMLPLAFPILLPLLVFVINGTTAALYGTGGNQLIALVSYLVAMVTLSAMLFDRVWTDA